MNETGTSTTTSSTSRDITTTSPITSTTSHLDEKKYVDEYLTSSFHPTSSHQPHHSTSHNTIHTYSSHSIYTSYDDYWHICQCTWMEYIKMMDQNKDQSEEETILGLDADEPTDGDERRIAERFPSSFYTLHPLIDTLHDLAGYGAFSDAIYHIGKDATPIPAHRQLLAMNNACADAQTYPMEWPGEESDQEVIPLHIIESQPSLTPSSFIALLQAIYSHTCTLDVDMIPGLIQGANMYCVPSLDTALQTYIDTCICPENACQFWLMTSVLKDQFDAQSIASYIAAHASRIIPTSHFLQLSKESIIHFISKNTFICSEIMLFERVIAWSRMECKRQGLIPITNQHQRTVLRDILPHIRFPLMHINDLTERVLPHDLLSQNQLLPLLEYCQIADGDPNHPRLDTIPLEFSRTPRESMTPFDIRLEVKSSPSSSVDLLFDNFNHPICHNVSTSPIIVTSQNIFIQGIYQWEVALSWTSMHGILGLLPSHISPTLQHVMTHGWYLSPYQGRMYTPATYQQPHTIIQLPVSHNLIMRFDANKGSLTLQDEYTTDVLCPPIKGLPISMRFVACLMQKDDSITVHPHYHNNRAENRPARHES